MHVPPLNHIGLWVDNIQVAVEWLTKQVACLPQDVLAEKHCASAQGVRFAPGGIRQGASGLVAFIHPKGNEQSPQSGEGVLIELVQASPEVIAFYDKLPQ